VVSLQKKSTKSFLEAFIYLDYDSMSKKFQILLWKIVNFRKLWNNSPYAGVQSINDAFHIVNKVENVFVYTYIFNLIDNVECVVFALYSSMGKTVFRNSVCRLRKLASKLTLFLEILKSQFFFPATKGN
jgi:hypothetical protein